MLLRPHAPRQVGRAQHQPGGVGVQATPGAAAAHRPDRAHQQGQGVGRVDDEHAAHAIGMAGEGQAQLGAIDRHAVQQRVGHQRRPHGQHPAPPQRALAAQPGHRRTKRQGEQGQPERRVRFGPVQHHVADRVAVVDQHVQVRQGACDGAPGGRLPHGRVAAHHGHAHGGTQGHLREGIHGCAFSVHGGEGAVGRPIATRTLRAADATPLPEGTAHACGRPPRPPIPTWPLPGGCCWSSLRRADEARKPGHLAGLIAASARAGSGSMVAWAGLSAGRSGEHTWPLPTTPLPTNPPHPPAQRCW